MKKKLFGIFILCGISFVIPVIASGSLVHALEETASEEKTSESDESEYSDSEDDIYLIEDISVTSNLITDQTVEITLTNTGSSEVQAWAVAYEADYSVLSIENAVLILDNGVVEFRAAENNEELNPSESVTVTLTIDGTYDAHTNYRVYGQCDGLSESYGVYDCINYDAATGTTTLTTHDPSEVASVLSEEIVTQGSDDDDSEDTDALTLDSPSTVNIIGSDGRSRVSSVDIAPYRRIACLIIEWENGEVTSATGFMISAKSMLTSAHVVYNDTRGDATSVTAYFGANGSSYTKSVSATSWSWCSSYASNSSASNDWACIQFKSSTGRGYFSIASTTDSNLENMTLTVCGYPGDKKISSSTATVNGYLRYMYKMSGTPIAVGTRVIKYTIDTYEGQSGSPVYNSSNIVYGIHSKGNSSYNSAFRFTSSLISTFVSNGWCSES